jgi:hypothetical protein
MADIQTQFTQFDDDIRLKRFDENKTLRDKRDVILNKLRDKFASLRRAGEDIPSFEPLNQGSYQMGTGIQPGNGDYDIDVGLRFNCSKSKYPNPVDLKTLVADALKGHTELGTEIRRSCVTVYYKVDGEQAYHVDLAVYAYDNPDSATRRLFLAKGFRDSDEKNRWWEESDPQGLADWVEKRFSDEDDELQFLRIIRVLKRWKTEKFKTDGNNAPSGIGLTVAAGQWFAPSIKRDALAKTRTFNDLAAMQAFVSVLVSKFQPVETKPDGTVLYRLQVPVPVAPREDIFKKMSTGQMTTFRTHLIELQKLLAKVDKEVDPVEACKLMKKHFCEEFPVPEKSDTGKSLTKAIASGGISA